jgi:hypothetical protein
MNRNFYMIRPRKVFGIPLDHFVFPFHLKLSKNKKNIFVYFCICINLVAFIFKHKLSIVDDSFIHVYYFRSFARNQGRVSESLPLHFVIIFSNTKTKFPPVFHLSTCVIFSTQMNLESI